MLLPDHESDGHLTDSEINAIEDDWFQAALEAIETDDPAVQGKADSLYELLRGFGLRDSDSENRKGKKWFK